MITADELITRGEEYARHLLLEEREKQLDPLYYLIDPEDKIHLIPCTFKNDFVKKLEFVAVKQLAQRVNCQAVLFISEGWSVSREKGETGPQPSEDPKRIEVVSIMAVTYEASRTKLLHMVRDQVTKRLIGLEPMVEMTDGQGPLIDGLVQKPKPN